jgi:FixJ family two-component response regulator
MTAAQPKVFLLDDDPAVLKALTCLLRSADYRVEAFDCPEMFLRHHDPEQHGCLLLDFAMPGMNGLELQRRLWETDDRLPIIFLTGQGDIPTSVLAMKGGAVDFLTKPIDEVALFAAIDEALARDATAKRARSERISIQRRIASLTPRELEVLKLVVAGKLNKQIAAELGAAEKTIKIHRARAMLKMQAHSLAELVHLAEHMGLVANPHAGPADASSTDSGRL